MSDSTRYLQHTAAHQRTLVESAPSYRQETVAHHYASLAQTASDMLYLVRKRQFEPMAGEALEELIATHERQIAEAHWAAFGEWPTWWREET